MMVVPGSNPIMKTYRIAVIPGDGIGKEVLPPTLDLLAACGARFGIGFEWAHFEWSADYYFRHGRMMPVDGLDQLRPYDAILLGAVGHQELPDNVTLNGLLLPIRRGFDQYANVRPAVLFEGVQSPLANRRAGEIDMIVVRENTEGEYAQIGGFLYQGQPEEVAVQSSVFTRRGCERVIRHAFELARKRNGRKRVASITKSNAQGYSMVLWDRAFAAVAAEFPDIATEALLVDAAAMNFVRRPHTFDVVVASNLFGDILSDLSAMVCGSIGLAASANLDPTRRHPSMFEPVHGTAPDLYGKNIANPLAAFFSAAMMLDHIGHPEAGAAIEQAIRAVLAGGAVRTADLGGSSTTTAVAEAVISQVSSNA